MPRHHIVGGSANSSYSFVVARPLAPPDSSRKNEFFPECLHPEGSRNVRSLPSLRKRYASSRAAFFCVLSSDRFATTSARDEGREEKPFPKKDSRSHNKQALHFLKGLHQITTADTFIVLVKSFHFIFSNLKNHVYSI